jgi:hypothetical protein
LIPPSQKVIMSFKDPNVVNTEARKRIAIVLAPRRIEGAGE